MFSVAVTIAVAAALTAILALALVKADARADLSVLGVTVGNKIEVVLTNDLQWKP